MATQEAPGPYRPSKHLKTSSTGHSSPGLLLVLTHSPLNTRNVDGDAATGHGDAAMRQPPTEQHLLSVRRSIV